MGLGVVNQRHQSHHRAPHRAQAMSGNPFGLRPRRWAIARSWARVTRLQAGSVAVLLALAGLPTPLKASTDPHSRSYVPDWSTKAEIFEVQNASYLANSLKGTSRDQLRSVPEFLREQEIRDLKLQHDLLVRDYELKAKYGLLTQDEERIHYDAVRAFSKNMAVLVGRNQIRGPLDRFRTFAENDPVLSFAQRPIALVALAIAVYNGQPVLMGLGRDASLKARANVPASEAELIVNSPVLDTSLYMKTNAQTADEVAAQQLRDPLSRDERMRLSAGRSLGVLGLYSGLTYGNTTQTLSASLSKQLMSNLNASVNSRRPLNPSHDAGENSLNLNYGVSF